MTSTRRQLKQATRTRVIDAAAQLFTERGFTDTSVRAIAESSGVSIGTVISVGDKNALLVRVFDTMIAEEHAARADHGITSLHPETASCADRLSALVDPFVSLFTANPDLARSYASILVSGTHSSALFTDLASRLIEEFQGAITTRGCTSASDAPERARALYFMYVGTLFTWSARNSSDVTELRSSLHASFSAVGDCFD